MDKKQSQYASEAPSLTDLLNLPSKEEQKKPAQKFVTGLKAPVMGLAAAKKPATALKLVKRSATTAELDTKDTKSAKVELAIDTKSRAADTVQTAISETLPIQKVQEPVKTISAPKPTKTEKHKKPAVNPAIVRQGGGKVWQDASLVDWDSSHFLLFVGNLGPEVNEQLLQQTFGNPYPSVSRVRIVKDKKSDKSKGYGFVAFADGREFLKALKEMQGRWIGNRQCQIKKSDFNKKF
jgi:hypothetical protein